MKITVAGLGYVGLSMAVLLAQDNEVMAADIVDEKVDMVNRRESPIADEYIERYLAEKPLSLNAVKACAEAYRSAELIVVAAPTNYDEERNYFDTSAVESVIEEILGVNDSATIVIKSTVPVGYTVSVKERYNCGRMLAKRDDARPDNVAGVPDSGIAHAIGYSNESGIPFSRPFIKYTPTWPRSFMPTIQSKRNRQ